MGASPLTSQKALPPRTELAPHLDAIAKLAQSSPMVTVPEGLFLMGTDPLHSGRNGVAAPFDRTDLPQRRVWLDTCRIDRGQASLSEYLSFLMWQHQSPAEELQRLIWHVI